MDSLSYVDLMKLHWDYGVELLSRYETWALVLGAFLLAGCLGAWDRFIIDNGKVRRK